MATTATFNSTAKFQIKPEFATSIQGNVSSSHHISQQIKNFVEIDITIIFT